MIEPLPDTAIRATERWVADAWTEWKRYGKSLKLAAADIACIEDLLNEVKRLRALPNICSGCGERFPNAGAIMVHIYDCPNHPIASLRRERDALAERLRKYER